MTDAPTKGGREAQPQIGFDGCKRELYLPTKGFKQLHRKLKQHCQVDQNRDEINLDRLLKYDVYVLGAPQEPFQEPEMEALQRYVELGGSVLLLLGEGGEGSYSHLNEQLASMGIELNEDCVVRTVLHKYLHPKEVCVTNGVTNREINRAAGKTIIGAGAQQPNPFEAGSNEPAPPPSNITFVYPHGLTLNVQRPAVPLLSSGFMAYPLNRPICASYEHQPGTTITKSDPLPDDFPGRKEGRNGKFVVMGSALSFEDSWLMKEENDKLVTVLVDYMLHKLTLNQIDADDPDITDYHHLPDTSSLADRLRVAVEESDDLPRDFTQLFDCGQFKFDTDLIPEVVALHEQLGVKHEPLTLIHPEFQAPLPPRLPATFGPIHREPAGPGLELFDLDDEFASERVRMSQLTNKCIATENLEFFIHEGAEIMGVTKKLRSPRNRDPRALLDFIFRQVVDCKKSNQEVPGEPNRGGSAVMRIFRATAEMQGGNPTPFDGPWSVTLHVDFGRATVMGNLTFEQATPSFQQQEVVLRGQTSDDGSNKVLEWVAEVATLGGELITFRFQGALQQPPGAPAMIEGHAAWGQDQSVQFQYTLEEVQ